VDHPSAVRIVDRLTNIDEMIQQPPDVVGVVPTIAVGRPVGHVQGFADDFFQRAAASATS